MSCQGWWFEADKLSLDPWSWTVSSLFSVLRALSVTLSHCRLPTHPGDTGKQSAAAGASLLVLNRGLGLYSVSSPNIIESAGLAPSLLPARKDETLG